MDRIAVETTQVLVVADGDSTSAVSNKRGHLFEAFVAQLLGALGYEEPRTERLNVTSDGIEIDVEAKQKVTGHPLIAECKAYSTNVSADLLSAFLGKYGVRRMKDSKLVGLFVALPRLTANGLEQAQDAETVYDGFRCLGSYEVVELLEKAQLLPPEDRGPSPRTDPTVVITEHGLALAAKALDPKSRKATKVVVWAASIVPDPVLDLVTRSPLADGLAVVREGDEAAAAAPLAMREPPTIIAVRGSSADFDYQLPSAPRFFVGRKSVSSELGRRITTADSGQTVVINAKSGWGKSSLALHLAKRVEQARGVALVVDTRTAERSDFIPAVLERLASEASRKRVLDPPADATFSSLAAGVRTLSNATPRGSAKPLLLFFDQFENVFRDEALTRSFRDLALQVQEVELPLTIAFAWKTDLVGWTEGHPYQLRDEIRGSAMVTTLEHSGQRRSGPSWIGWARLPRRSSKRTFGDASASTRKGYRGCSRS
jgi:Novel STAND NTPase 1/Restriction endonuclease